MKKSAKQKSNVPGRSSRWTYVRLKDGRSIASPEAEGKFTKEQIREAVRSAQEKQLLSKAG